jgi:lysophospholipase L1-like esterase
MVRVKTMASRTLLWGALAFFFGGLACSGVDAADPDGQAGASGGAGSSSGGGHSGGSANESGGAGGTATSGGAPGSAGSPSGGDSAAYEPCPTSGDCRIMPLGDSITWGVGDEGNAGYRGPLFAHILADGKKATFTGSGQNGPSTVSGVPFPQRNEGHPGWGIARVTTWSNGNAGIAQQIPSPAFDSPSGGVPHIILLHIGTNDANQFTADVMESDLNTLLDKLVAGAPEALIVLAKIIPPGWYNQQLTNYNAKLAGIVDVRAAAGEHIVLADLNSDFDTKTMLGSDSLHPNTAGYEFMAKKWYAIISPYLF